jgi:LysM repeat protein
MQKTLYFLLSSFILTGCTSNVLAFEDKHNHSSTLHEIQIELADLRHKVNNSLVEIQILEEGSKNDSTTSLEKRLTLLEQKQAKLSNSLSEYSSKMLAIENAIDAQKKILTELNNLKSTIGLLANSLEKTDSQTYKVKPGDSLEKIARLHKTTVSYLKEINNLSSNKIMIGQELKISLGDF